MEETLARVLRDVYPDKKNNIKAEFQAYLDSIGADFDIEAFQYEDLAGNIDKSNAMLERAAVSIQIEINTLNETREELQRLSNEAYSQFDAPIKAIYQNESYDLMDDD